MAINVIVTVDVPDGVDAADLERVHRTVRSALGSDPRFQELVRGGEVTLVAQGADLPVQRSVIKVR